MRTLTFRPKATRLQHQLVIFANQNFRVLAQTFGLHLLVKVVQFLLNDLITVAFALYGPGRIRHSIKTPFFHLWAICRPGTILQRYYTFVGRSYRQKCVALDPEHRFTGSRYTNFTSFAVSLN